MSGWARQNILDSVDIDGLMPDDPNLYTDGGHDVDFAWKLRAWIIFQSMIPLLENDIKAGLVPRPGPKTRNAHPFIHNPPLQISRKELLDYYAEEERANFNWLQMPDLAHGLDEDLLQAHPLSLDAFTPVDDAHLVGKSPLAIVTGSKKAGHAAIYPLKGSIHKPGSPAIVRINLHVDEGEFGVGLLSKDKKRAYSYTVVSKRPDPANLHLFIDSMEDVGSIVFANHREADGQSSRVSIFSIDVFQ
jgi:hypothetical protein